MRDGNAPKRQYTDEFKVEAVRLSDSVGGHEAARRLGIPSATLSNWSRKRRPVGLEPSPEAPSQPLRRPVTELEAENSRLRKELADAKLDVEILRKATLYQRCCSDGLNPRRRTLPRCRDEVRLDREQSQRIHGQPAVPGAVGVPHGGYCQWRVRPLSARALANAVLDTQVATIHRESRRSYGRPRITQELREQGQCVSAVRVRRSLRRQGLRPVYRRAYVMTTDSAHSLPVAANILDRRFDGWQPNRAWVADITYVTTGEGWLYLATVMDLASRRIVGWSMSETIDAKLVCAALRSAYWQRKPAVGLLVHTDRGSQYASFEYRRLAADFGITMSMSRKGNAWDNAAMESFFKTLKVERIYQVRYDTRAQARLDIEVAPLPRTVIGVILKAGFGLPR